MKDAAKKRFWFYCYIIIQIPSFIFLRFCNHAHGNTVKNEIPIIYPDEGIYTGYALRTNDIVAEITIEQTANDTLILSLTGNSFSVDKTVDGVHSYQKQEIRNTYFEKRFKDLESYWVYFENDYVYILINTNPSQFFWIPDKSIHYLKDIFYITKISISEYNSFIRSEMSFWDRCFVAYDRAEYACYFYQDRNK